MAFGSFSSLFIVLCTSPLSFLVSLHVDTCYLLGIHFPCLHIINSFQEKQHCSRTCYCSNFSNEHYPIPFYFRLYYFRNFPDKTYSPLKKCIALAQCLGGQYTFFRTSQQPISVRHDHAETKLSHNILILCSTMFENICATDIKSGHTVLELIYTICYFFYVS